MIQIMMMNALIAIMGDAQASVLENATGES